MFFNNTSQTIAVGSIDAIYSDYRHSYDYYMVEFTYSPYIIQ